MRNFSIFFSSSSILSLQLIGVSISEQSIEFRHYYESKKPFPPGDRPLYYMLLDANRVASRPALSNFHRGGAGREERQADGRAFKTIERDACRYAKLLKFMQLY
ncbi:hypothetical protein EVAR_4058_1 [Eumeta japonica]|uniref:Secreted protein n=1 Tax=Eumeta variegata TaxID=151549 RepID=A0A4C1T3V0_EUMVA|nr:hypothetical protein EVAR_4058_1 [Eumeta japonica]